MLDLDAIADRRAKTLSQDAPPWRAAVWSAPFQDLSSRLTDGEVIDLLDLCANAGELDQMTRVLVERAVDADLTPLDWLKREAAAADLSPLAWIKTLKPTAGA